MLNLWIASFLLQTAVYVQCFPNLYPEIRLPPRDGGDAGSPLFLTPYVESGNIEEGRRLARVPFTEGLGIKSSAGFFTVNKTYNSNHFFWYFPATNTNNGTAPVLLWLQGGPGGSSLYGLFTENGPIKVFNETFQRRKYHWALNHHLVYIDNPVGAGFSFTNDSRGYCTEQTQVGEQLYSTMVQFFQLYPELQQSEFFITGESYAGKYVPTLAYTIHTKNPSAQIKINLKGIAIGDGWSDPIHQQLYSKYLYQLGLVDWNQANKLEEHENDTRNFIAKKQWSDAFCSWSATLDYFNSSSGFDSLYNILRTKDNVHDEDYGPMIQKTYVRKDIHVGELDFFGVNNAVYNNFTMDMMQTVAPWIAELLDHYNVLVYSGQLDIIVAYPLTVNYLRNLNFTGSEEYKTAKRHIWMVEDDVAGYVKRAGRLVEVLVRNAGHMVPADQPKWALDMITRFTHYKSFDHGRMFVQSSLGTE